MKKVLFITCSFYNYETEIIKLMKEILNFEVEYIDLDSCRYSYQNIWERLYNNFITQPLLNRRLKTEKYIENMSSRIDEVGEVDYIFIIAPWRLNHPIMKKLKSMNKPMLLHCWDSFSAIKNTKEYLKYFDYITSFDKKESEEYGLKHLPNFYISKNIVKTSKIKYKAFCVMKYDDRFKKLENLGKYFKEKNIEYLFIVIDKNRKIKSDFIEIRDKNISLEEVNKYISESDIMVEIGHTGIDMQGGLSFRAIDAIGNRKKIITNYEFIKDYDFYDSKNIAIINDNNTRITEDFIEEKYREIPMEIYTKYSGENWIKEIFKQIK